MLVDRLRILKHEEFGVLGYLGDVLVGITNPSTTDTVDFLLVISADDQRPVSLAPGSTYDLGIDTATLIRKRHMPHVRTTQTIILDILWTVVS